MTAWFLPKGQVWKLVWKMTFFGLQKGQDLENKEDTPIKNFQEYHPPYSALAKSLQLISHCVRVSYLLADN